jgi:Tfp pilus assembly protein FimT
MERGTTLLELAIALAVAGLVSAMALPRIASLRDQWLVDEAAHSLALAHTRARWLALAERRVMLLTLTPDSLVLAALESPTDTVERWRTGGARLGGVSTTGLPRSVSFAPSGVTFGFSNGTYVFTRGAARRQVVVSRYGRVRIQ